jgi:hypothetical protein
MRQEPKQNGASTASVAARYEVVETLREGSVACAISMRQHNGLKRYAFAFHKEYEKDGETKRSNWFDKRHLSDLASLIERAEDRIETLEDQSRGARRAKRG